ncbi:MAG: hypothetical protein WBQ86_23190 [Candidatus Binatus sp.]
MKSTVAAAAAIALALAATTASAGVVISQEAVTKVHGRDRKVEQTVMIQGHKRKVIASEKGTVTRETVTDVDAGKIYMIFPKVKQFAEFKFPPEKALALMVVWEESTIDLDKKTDGTDKVAGYACQDYAGSSVFIFNNIDVTKCLATAAPGAKEFFEFEKALAQKLQGTPLAPKGEIPYGIPVSATFTSQLVPFTPPAKMPPEEAAKVKEKLAKYRPVTSNVTVSKIEVKDIPADAFVVPAGYTPAPAATLPQPLTPPVKPGSASAPPGSSTKPGAPTAL